MKLSFAEFGHEYDSYSFGYTVHGIWEASDGLESLYGKGMLPYSAVGSEPDLFYMSRSVRVPILAYEASSENRRILRKFDDEFECSYIEGDALRASSNFRTLMLAYFSERHGKDVMPAERLEQILSRTLPLRAAAYMKDGVVVAYVLEVVDPAFVHYWYSCYDLAYAGTSLGMWLMLDAIRRASAEGRAHIYMGTAYGEKARYKTNIPALEYWTGNVWNSDPRALQALMRLDATGNPA
ncbi:MAG: Arginine-tRNA-protein transferase domain protein [Parcubacteria group bacterium]|nr:Arginine-tRNA-protein transferase domain protein [Parcubacteria group bacterium]